MSAGMLDQVLDYLKADQPAARDRLVEFLTIPSVSTDPAYTQQVHQAAQWVVQRLGECGLLTQVIATAGHPVVIGRSLPDMAPPNAPTVLYYGHYDVQPPDPLEEWATAPFQPTVRDGAIYARGACDDKGQVSCFLEALRAWSQTTGTLPCHVIVMIEGEEECGSANLPAMLEARKQELAADIVVISDTTMWDRQTVAITYGLRGLLYYDVQLHHANRDLHSGMYGGVLANPATMLTRVLGRLFDDDHRVTIPHFYDDVLPLSPQEKRQWADLCFDEMHQCLAPVGVGTAFGEAGFTTLERLWSRPACDINGLYGGYGGAGAKTVIPSFAGAKISFRLAPDQDPAKIGQAFEHWLTSYDVRGCQWQLQQLGSAHPVVVPSNSPYIAAAQKAVECTSGRPAVLVREGATLPVVADFKRILAIDSLLLGFGLKDDCIHAPNEKFNLSCFELGCRTHAVLLAELSM